HGRGPFARDSTAATIAAVVNADVPTTRTRGPLGAVIAGLLQRDPRARLTGIQAIALLSGEPPTPPTGVQVGPTGTITRTVATPGQPAVSGRRRWPLLLGALALGLVVGLAAGLLWPRGTSGPLVYTYGAGGDIPAIATSTPSCLQGQLAPGRQYTSYAVCEEPHDLEVFANVDLLDVQLDEPYPGREALAAPAGSACTLAFSTMIVGQDKAGLRVAALVPSEAAFADRASPTSSFGTRSVLCALYAADGSQITGSRLAKGA
ncbi:MAG: hypothetical protein H0X35_15880, partial [Pseudonocardiales bacterium]|nr:hypothetical protein [Pseudonocardiales bacterium]